MTHDNALSKIMTSYCDESDASSFFDNDDNDAGDECLQMSITLTEERYKEELNRLYGWK